MYESMINVRDSAAASGRTSRGLSAPRQIRPAESMLFSFLGALLGNAHVGRGTFGRQDLFCALSVAGGKERIGRAPTPYQAGPGSKQRQADKMTAVVIRGM